MKTYWIITILACWLSIGAGFIAGAAWCGYWHIQKEPANE